MLNIFTRTKPGPPAEIQKPIRSAAPVQAELAMARESISPLQEKLHTAQLELSEAQRSYDAGVQAYALGHVHIEPDRADLQAAITKTDALRRVTQQQERAITQLSSELTEAELSEATAAGESRLALLSAAAEAKLAEFEAALITAKAAEQALFTLAFDESSGLKQAFPDSIRKEAAQVRWSLRARSMEIAERLRFALNPRFETDGLPNLGFEDSEYRWRHLLRR